VALVRTDVSEEPGASFIRGTIIGELGTTQAATSNRRTLRRNTKYFFAAYGGCELHEPHGVTTQKTPFFKLVLIIGGGFTGQLRHHEHLNKVPAHGVIAVDIALYETTFSASINCFRTY
jgi:hypothetical protein